MKTDIKGISQCPNGQENFETYYSEGLRRTLIQYDYRTPKGKLFSCVSETLNGARSRRDRWIENHPDA